MQELPRSRAGSADNAGILGGCRLTGGGWGAVFRERHTFGDRSTPEGACFPSKPVGRGAAIRFTACMGIGNPPFGWKHLAVRKADAGSNQSAGRGGLSGISL